MRPGGIPGGSIKQLQQMQQRLMKIQEELANETIEATAGGGAVTVVMNGHQQVKSVKIEPEVVDANDVTMLEDILVAAINEAVEKSQQLASKRMSALTGGLRIPGLM